MQTERECQHEACDECGSTRSGCGPTRIGCGPGQELFRVLCIAIAAVSGAILHPVCTLRHCAGFCSLLPYREVDRKAEAESTTDWSAMSTTEEERQNTSQGRKRKTTRRIKKTLKKGVQYYGNSATICGSPIGSTYIARDIQQRISMSNYQYVEMRDVYVPSYGVFL